MRKIERLEKVLSQLKIDIKKNPLYTLEDIKTAFNQVVDIYINKKYNNLKMVSYGNLKLSKNIMILNMPSVITCKYACKSCYTLKAERLYKNTRIQRLRNYIIILLCQYDNNFKKIILQYFNNILNQHALLYNNNAIMRIHESGDIFNKKYLNFLLKIVVNNPKIKFYSYSKQLTNKQIDNINKKYNNFNIVKSIIDINNKKYINYGSHDYIEKLKNELLKNHQTCYICTYGSDNALKCGLECKACCNCSNILFYQH